MRYASVCSGVEAATLAWVPLGWEAVWFSETEPFPCAVLKKRFPGIPNLGDMTKIKGEEYRGRIDLLVGGTPCQGFSVAGRQGGINDPRSALCLSYCRLLETMRPRWFVWENVPGVFSTNGGEDFRAFLRKIDEIGYSCAWRVLDAQYVRVDGFPRAVPQRRRRVFVVGYSGDWRYPASVLFEPGCLPGDTPPRRIKGVGVARSLTASTGGSSGKEQPTFISGDGRPLNALGVNGLVMDTVFWNGEDVSTTLTEAFADDRMPDKGKLPCVICRAGFSGGQDAKAGTGGGNLPLVQECFPATAVRRLLPIETERLMGFPDNHTRVPWRGKPEEKCPDGPRYKACGNSMCVNVMRWIGMRIENVEKTKGSQK